VLYAGDLNNIQDHYADLSNFTQTHDVGTLRVGETGLQLLRYGSLEARLTGYMRVDNILRGLGGLYAGQFTTTARDALSATDKPNGLIIYNTTTGRLEVNVGRGASPVWQSPAFGMNNSDLAAGAGITDANLASPNSGTYRLVSQASARLDAAGLGTYLFRQDGGIYPVNTANAAVVPIIDLQASNFVVAGKTAKLALRVAIATNATASTSTFNVRCYPLTDNGGGATIVQLNTGTNVIGVNFGAPSASVISRSQSTNVTFPADGAYALGVDVAVNSMVPNSSIVISAYLLVNYV